MQGFGGCYLPVESMLLISLEKLSRVRLRLLEPRQAHGLAATYAGL